MLLVFSGFFSLILALLGHESSAVATECPYGDIPSLQLGGKTHTCHSALTEYGPHRICESESLGAQCCESCKDYDPAACTHGDTSHVVFGGKTYDDCASAVTDRGVQMICEHANYTYLCCETCSNYDLQGCLYGDVPYVRMSDGIITDIYNCSAALQKFGAKRSCADTLKSHCCKSCADFEANPCSEGDRTSTFTINGDSHTCESIIKDYGLRQVCEHDKLQEWCCQSCENYDPSACEDAPGFVFNNKYMTCAEAFFWYEDQVCGHSWLSEMCCLSCATVSVPLDASG